MLIDLLMLLCAVGFILTLACGVIGALTPVSRAKGRIRLAGSLIIGIAIPLGAIAQAVQEGRLRLGVGGILGGTFLVFVGLRKYHRDPEGRTPPAQLL
jgi:hypothetical protein